ncbi:MAG: hypothetical protein FK731_01850 [Asgard group archaeon]|nr:hypothetical protein [Asgard group archaeon]
MASSKTYSIIAWILIIIGLGGAGFGLYEYGFNGQPSYSLPVMIIGFLILISGITLYILGFQKKKQEKESRLISRAARRTPSVYEEVELETEKMSESEKLEMKRLSYEKTGIKAIYIPIVPPGNKCMISKTKLTSAHEILQCPYCKSYFLLDYLVDWVNKNNNCPVCKAILK